MSCALFHIPQAIYPELQPLPCWIYKQHTGPADLCTKQKETLKDVLSGCSGDQGHYAADYGHYCQMLLGNSHGFPHLQNEAYK